MSTTTYRSHLEQPFKTVGQGVHVSVLRRHGGQGEGMTMVFRMEKGSHAPLHSHPGGEETYLLSGKLRVGSRVLLPGDYLWTEPGEVHDGFAEEDSLFFVVLPGGIQITE
ncbi:cupin domain-containing protein [Pendulispora brunnea]|uniref:Cupin domain-containing protein n=1 Tax=Pendulispora brunnea TaxID=2905690 RepID=A0ABZ2KAH2_9BACT